MATSWVDSLPRRFARRAAEELAKIYGVEGARARIAERMAKADAEQERMFRDVLVALDEMGDRSSN